MTLKAWRLSWFVVAVAMAAKVLLGDAALAARADSLNDRQQDTIKNISSYFNEMKDVQGEFTQISPRGKVSTGTFYISKPGKLRFEYAAPNPFLIVSDGTWLVVKNTNRNRADQYPLSKTPLRLMLSEHVDLLEEAVIKEVELNEGVATVTLEDKDQLVPGQLVLIYDTEQDQLQQWIVVDGQGRRTTVSLNKIEPGVDPNPSLFDLKLPKRRSKTDR